MVPRANKIADSLQQEFQKLCIPYESPGFYDHPNFVKAELKNASFLEKYAFYVTNKRYEETYKDFVRSKIVQVSQLLFVELEKDGRLGACLDVSAALSSRPLITT